MSELILKQFSDKEVLTSEYDRIDHYMDLGDKVRKESGDNGILMAGVAAYIHGVLRGGKAEQLPRKAYIIDSIKHPAEIQFLRDTYGEGFHLMGITDDYENRFNYLRNRKGMTEEQAHYLLKRDECESGDEGQHTRDAFQEADYFIEASPNRAHIEADVRRLFELLFGNPFITPTFEEYAMFRAYVASLRSADLSRQVGAVVARDNEILSEGTNDCPKFGGGLYWPMYDERQGYYDVPGGRDYTLGFDPNKRQQKKIIEAVLGALEMPYSEEYEKKVKQAGIGSLTEYGRVVHAEMEALSMCARNGISTRGACMYVTTFPCHNCAKHIIASGIRKFVYIEPYPKSKTLDFYDVEMGVGGDGPSERVALSSFYGVGPHRFVDLFSMKSTKWRERRRKDSGGKSLKWNVDDADLRNPVSPISYLSVETAAYGDYYEKVHKLMGEEHAEE